MKEIARSIARSIVEQINQAHARFVKVGEQAGEQLVEYVNAGREVGLYLHTLRANEPQWQQLTLLDAEHHAPDMPRINFDEKHAKAFMRLAERLKEAAITPSEAISSMKDAMMLQGTLPFPEGHGRQQLHERDSLSIIIRHAMELQATFNKDVKGRISEWSDERKQHARDQIEPAKRALDTIYEELAA